MNDTEANIDDGMVWAIKVPGHPDVLIEDFPFEVLQRISEETDIRWSYFAEAAPLGNLRCAHALLLRAYQERGVAPPDPLPLKVLKASFHLVKSTLPTMFDEGHPKEAAAT